MATAKASDLRLRLAVRSVSHFACPLIADFAAGKADRLAKVASVGFEPTKAEANRFTVCPR